MRAASLRRPPPASAVVSMAAFAGAPFVGTGLPAARGLVAGVQLVRRALCMAAAPPGQPRRMPAISRPLVPSRELQAFVQDKVQPRSAVLKALSQYVKEHGLQNPDQKTMVLCDEPLRSLFGVDTCSFLGMSKYISPHLSKPEDVGGKYVAEAKQYEEAWVAENGSKPRVKRVKSKRNVSNEEAREKGTGLWRPVQLSEDLAKICGNRTQMPRQEIIKAVWAYIRLNNLQAGPGKPIRCDFLLEKVFHKESITSRDVMGGISPHVIKK